MKFETIYFVERKSKTDVLKSEVLEWTMSFSSSKADKSKIDLEKTVDEDTYYCVRSIVISD